MKMQLRRPNLILKLKMITLKRVGPFEVLTIILCTKIKILISTIDLFSCGFISDLIRFIISVLIPWSKVSKTLKLDCKLTLRMYLWFLMIFVNSTPMVFLYIFHIVTWSLNVSYGFQGINEKLLLERVGFKCALPPAHRT